MSKKCSGCINFLKLRGRNDRFGFCDAWDSRCNSGGGKLRSSNTRCPKYRAKPYVRKNLWRFAA